VNFAVASSVEREIVNPVILKGDFAFSCFRIAALLESLRKAAPDLDVAEIIAPRVYFIEEEKPVSADIRERAYTLLGSRRCFEGGEGFFVTPRKGTISPWSSKATDIFRNCGLEDFLRVERGIHYRLLSSAGQVLDIEQLRPVLHLLHDRMTEGVYTDVSDIFKHLAPAPFTVIDIMGHGRDALKRANREMGLALSDGEIDYLCEAYKAINRNPTDVELVMFGQVNSEHCRHKIFNAEWRIDGEARGRSLFGMIRNTHEKHPEGTLVAYRDNSAVVEGFEDEWFEVRRDGANVYRFGRDTVDMIMKVETHNHPTAISPYPGAATGVGGEIRDESATGTGGKSKAGLSAFMVSNLRMPGFIMPWEKEFTEFPSRLATPLKIMIEGPIGGAGFGNEFGRPQLFGLFKTYEQMYNGRYRGYHKPIMVAGGMGNIKRTDAYKKDIPKGALIIQIGGPAMRIGLGGGAASSMATGSNIADLDFDSVQRDNAEMERRCQEVIDACTASRTDNPILSIHDLGAGGLSNGCPELVSKSGGRFRLRSVPNEDSSMSPMEIWCCEAQERYVLAIAPESLDKFLELCQRERCPVAVIGEATGDGHVSLHDEHFDNEPIDIDIGVILGQPPRMLRDARHLSEAHAPFDLTGITLNAAVDRVLRLPAVANKTFLITIADRSVTGMVARDQMVGPYQIPISDVAVTVTSYKSRNGEAMAMGERTCIAPVCAPASGRMAVGEAITNIAAADIGEIGKVKLSANWMCACGEEGEDANLYDTVRAVGMELCPKLGVSIPVGKDSLSMRTIWETSDGREEKMIAPLSLVISAFAPVRDVRKTVTPDLKPGKSALILLDLGRGRNRLGCSALAQVYNQAGKECADLDYPGLVVGHFNAVQEMIAEGILMAYHDRSDGGLFVTVAEMAFGGRRGTEIILDDLGEHVLPILFAEELGAVLQVAEDDLDRVHGILTKHALSGISRNIGTTSGTGDIRLWFKGREVFGRGVSDLNRMWSELTYHMQAVRDNPECAKDEYDNLLDESDPGMNFKLTFDPSDSTWRGGKMSDKPATGSRGSPHGKYANVSAVRPRTAILREQGINGQVEMAAAFDLAGFECVDVHMTDLLAGRIHLDDFVGLVACGGFSYGDVLGAGSGWAKSVLFNENLKRLFASFFERKETFALGVCNGCQMISQMKEIIPGAMDWPEFTRNKSEQFEARYVTVEITPSPSILLRGMEGSRLGIPVAHGEGFASFETKESMNRVLGGKLLSMRYVDNYGRPTERYPFNPNGSPDGITGVTTPDGRVTIMMPHPERAFRSVQMSYKPAGMFGSEEGPWLRMFQNAREYAG